MTSSGSTVLFGAIPDHLKPSVIQKRALGHFVHLLCRQVAGLRPFVCLLANDAHLRRLNLDFLGNDHATDVLSFPAAGSSKAQRARLRAAKQNSDPPSLRAAGLTPCPSCASSVENLGEIAISMERAAAQAAEFGHACLDEVRILMLHGVLHLTGLDHETGDSKMAREEKRWRAEFNLPETLIARAGPKGPVARLKRRGA